MAKKPAAVKPAAPAANVLATAAVEPVMHTVRVARVVEVMGFRYKPGHDHRVDDATFAALKAQDALAGAVA